MSNHIRIAFLGNITTEYIGKSLSDTCNNYSFSSNIYHAPFGQYMQEILEQNSKYYAFCPDLTIPFLDPRE